MPKRQQPPPPTNHPSTCSSPPLPVLPLESLPDAALALVAGHLKPSELIMNLQLVNRWALSSFVQQTKEVIIWSVPIVTEDPPPASEEDNKEAYKAWLEKHTPQLGSFLARLVKITILKADHFDEDLRALLNEVFLRQTFPTIQRFLSIQKLLATDWLYRLPLSLLRIALPGLVAVWLVVGEALKDSLWREENFENLDAFLEGLADGTAFPRLQEFSLEICLNNLEEVSIVVKKVTAALLARETLGTCPPLSGLYIACAEHTPVMEDLLSLQSCGNLRSLGGDVVLSNVNDALAFTDTLASYLRRTACEYLETLELCQGAEANETLGPLTDVLMSGMASNLTQLHGACFSETTLADLSTIIQSGGLPNLAEVHLLIQFLEEPGCLPLITNAALSPRLTSFQLAGCPDLQAADNKAFLQALLDGTFPKLKSVDLGALNAINVDEFLVMLRDAGGGGSGAQTLREVFISKEVSEETFQELKTLLPAAAVRIVP